MWQKCQSDFYCSAFTLGHPRKGGTNKLLRVLGESGWHGFAYPLAFPSVPALVEHYRETSLAEYNPSLDIRLLHPVPDPKKVWLKMVNVHWSVAGYSTCLLAQLCSWNRKSLFLFNLKQLAGIVCLSIVLCIRMIVWGAWIARTGMLWWLYLTHRTV